VADRADQSDFAALAQPCGAHGRTVTDPLELPAALADALAADGPAIVSIRTDPDLL